MKNLNTNKLKIYFYKIIKIIYLVENSFVSLMIVIYLKNLDLIFYI